MLGQLGLVDKRTTRNPGNQCEEGCLKLMPREPWILQQSPDGARLKISRVVTLRGDGPGTWLGANGSVKHGQSETRDALD